METPSCPTCGLSFQVGVTFCPHDGTPLEEAPAKESLSSPSGFGPGFQVEQYIVEEKVGEGGMGEVWRGRHPQIGKKVAIKVLTERSSKNQKTVTRFMHEALAVNEIRSRYIVDIFSFGELPDGRPYFIMEYLEGKSLADYLHDKHVLPFAEILPLLKPICKGLGAAHERGIIHRDLKPDNLFLILEEDEPPFVKILDFGIAKLAGEGLASAQSLTKSGAVFGTPAYMSPEQCEGTKKVDHRSDIYALGIVLYEMLCGRSPFCLPGEGLGTVISRHMYAPIPLPSEMIQGRVIPKEVDALILRVLAKDPEERPASCAEFYEALLQAVGPLREERSLGETRSASSLPGVAFGFDAEAGGRAKLDTHAIKDAAASRPEDYYASTHPTQDEPGGSGRSLWRRRLFYGLGALFLFGGVGLGYTLYPSSPLKKTPASSPAKALVPPLGEDLPPASPKTSPQPTTEASTAPSRPEKIVIKISSTPKGARVSLGGEFLGKTPLTKEIAYSEEEALLAIEKDGYETFQQEVVVSSLSKPLRVPLVRNKVNTPKNRADKKEQTPAEPPNTNKTDDKKTTLDLNGIND